jgi:hypothetical protein
MVQLMGPSDCKLDNVPGFHVFFALAYSGATALLAAKHEPLWVLALFALMMITHARKAQYLWSERAKRTR